jgi:uncharacterized protein YjbJ (UPF0337 family)
MDENRIAGNVRDVGGKLEEGLGRVTGDARTQADGLVKQFAGAVQNTYGQAADVASNAAGNARDTAITFEKLLRDTVETKPYTSVLVGIGVGWLVARMLRSV